MSVTKTYQRTLCLCGNKRLQAEDWCSECAARSRLSHPKSTGQSRRVQYTLTPPPSAPGSPRQELALTTTGSPRQDLTLITPSALSRPSFASQALTSAMSYEDTVPNMFPASMYHIPSRTRQSSGGGSRAATNLRAPSLPSPPLSGSPSIKPSRAPTPEMRSHSVGGYAPMAAGFARLGHNSSHGNSTTDVAKLGRPGSARPSLDLDVRMFSGPA